MTEIEFNGSELEETLVADGSFSLMKKISNGIFNEICDINDILKSIRIEDKKFIVGESMIFLYMSVETLDVEIRGFEESLKLRISFLSILLFYFPFPDILYPVFKSYSDQISERTEYLKNIRNKFNYFITVLQDQVDAENETNKDIMDDLKNINLHLGNIIRIYITYHISINDLIDNV